MPPTAGGRRRQAAAAQRTTDVVAAVTPTGGPDTAVAGIPSEKNGTPRQPPTASPSDTPLERLFTARSAPYRRASHRRGGSNGAAAHRARSPPPQERWPPGGRRSRGGGVHATTASARGSDTPYAKNTEPVETAGGLAFADAGGGGQAGARREERGRGCGGGGWWCDSTPQPRDARTHVVARSGCHGAATPLDHGWHWKRRPQPSVPGDWLTRFAACRRHGHQRRLLSPPQRGRRRQAGAQPQPRGWRRRPRAPEEVHRQFHGHEAAVAHGSAPPPSLASLPRAGAQICRRERGCPRPHVQPPPPPQMVAPQASVAGGVAATPAKTGAAQKPQPRPLPPTSRCRPPVGAGRVALTGALHARGGAPPAALLRGGRSRRSHGGDVRTTAVGWFRQHIMVCHGRRASSLPHPPRHARAHCRCGGRGGNSVATDGHSSQSAAAVNSNRFGYCRGLVAPSHLSGRRMSHRLARILGSVEEYTGMDRCAKRLTLPLIHEHSALSSERLFPFE